MKRVTLQITLEVANNRQVNNYDDIVKLLTEFPKKVIYIDGKRL